MSSIEIKRAHNRPLADAKASVERVAKHIAERFGVDYRWEGNTLHFTRSGVDGHIKVAAKQVLVNVQLGFLLSAIRGSVEREIHRFLDEEFG